MNKKNDIKKYEGHTEGDDLTYCPNCGLNPNYHQPEEQQKWESDYVKEHGLCHYCVNVGTGDEEEVIE